MMSFVRRFFLVAALGAAALPGAASGQSALDEVNRVVASLPPGLFGVSDLDVFTEGDGTITATGTITLLGSRTDVLVAISTIR